MNDQERLKPLELVRRAERMELELTQWNAIRALSGVEKRLEAKRIGETTLLIERTAPDSVYYNRVKGFGPADLPELDDILAAYEGFAPSFDMAPPNMTEDIGIALTERGYAPAEQLAFLYTERSEDWQAGSLFHIERVTDAAAADTFIEWIVLSNPGLNINEATIARTRDCFHAPNFRNYMIRIDDHPAAMGSMFLHGEEGYIANDYTFPDFRGRGCQSALLKARMHDAAELGLKRLYTDVEFGSVSHGNMEKAGFRLAYVNTIWLKIDC
ncbi:GNAT family N-acetyltransferase [Paenibacillus sp. LHD-117]|uniref:GNAT family N-acetyltransferase n=1 Tax=Paenibacillus sp. LHD-117 TaxID=3071412 RepID=UPI0027DF75EA|nr:GNAT family N-acetyltransferase [Paenibacillus sp. LHD-117]MDQ6418879.1 GNAT family N-acetyltransferase [Paenibacillus sp. LHD-117]